MGPIHQGLCQDQSVEGLGRQADLLRKSKPEGLASAEGGPVGGPPSLLDQAVHGARMASARQSDQKTAVCSFCHHRTEPCSRSPVPHSYLCATFGSLAESCFQAWVTELSPAVASVERFAGHRAAPCCVSTVGLS